MPALAALVAQFALPADGAAHRAAPAPTLRRVRTEDAAAVSCFLRGLSDTSRRLRFHGGCNPQSQAMAQRLCQVDGMLHQAWLAWVGSGDDAAVVGEARFVVASDGRAGMDAAELAIAVADGWQGRGLADMLMQQLLAAAAQSGVRTLWGDMLPGNTRMRVFMRRHGFDADLLTEGGVVRMHRAINPVRPTALLRALRRACCACLALWRSGARQLAVQTQTDSPSAVQP
jgi:GNAT superfamily N-acetyltransferase